MIQKVFSGENSIYRLTSLLKELSPEKVLIVRGKQSYITSGAKQAIDSLFRTNEVQVKEFCDFSENPKEEDVLNGIKLVNNLHPDLIIGIGGGSVLDMSKLIRFYYSYPFPENPARQ